MGEVSHHPPDNGGNNATSSPSFTRASSFTCRRFTAASGRGGNAPAPGTVSRTRESASATVAALSAKRTAGDSQPVSAGLCEEMRLDTLERFEVYCSNETHIMIR